MAPIPDPPSPYDTSYDPNAPVSGLPPTATIVEIYPAIMREKPETIRNAAHGWNRLCSNIWSTYYHVGENGKKLRSHWKSEAAEYFFPYVYGTRTSMDEWQNIAYTNSTVLFDLADTVQNLQSVMHEIWQRFSHDQAQNYDAENSSGLGEATKDTGEALSGDIHRRINSTLEDFTNEAIEKALTPFSNAFSMAWSTITVGNKFQGPTDAEKPADGALERVMNALTPIPRGPGAPSMPGSIAPPAVARPTVPAPPEVVPLPSQPRATAPPELPNKPSTAPDAATAPNAPTTPNAPIRPGAPSMPGAPLMPEAPAMSRQAAPSDFAIGGPSGTAPTDFSLPAEIAATDAEFGRATPPAMPADIPTSGSTGGSVPGRPATLQGRSMARPPAAPAPGGDEMPPRLSGRSGSGRDRDRRPPTPGPEEPGRETFPGMPSRGGPLLGRRGEQDPDGRIRRVQPSFDGTGTPRQLQGIRGPGAQIEPELEARRGLGGRLGPNTEPAEETLQDAQRALRPGLGGRGRAARSRPREESRRSEEREVYLGVDERFEVEKPPSLLDRPQSDAAATRPVPALRPPGSQLGN